VSEFTQHQKEIQMKKLLAVLLFVFSFLVPLAYADGSGAGNPSTPLPSAPNGVKITAMPQRDTDVGLVNVMQVIDMKCTMIVQSAPGYKLDLYVRYAPTNPDHKNVWAQVQKDGLECAVRQAAANLDQSYNIASVRQARPDALPAFWVLGNPTNPCGGVVVGNRQDGNAVGRWSKGNTLGQGTAKDNFNDMIQLVARSSIAQTSPRCLAYLRGFLGQPLQGPMGPAGMNGTNGTNGSNGVDGVNGSRGNFMFSGLIAPSFSYPARSEDLLPGDQYIVTLSDRLIYYRWDGKQWVGFFTLTQARDGIDGAPGNTGAAGNDGLNSVLDHRPATKAECAFGGTVLFSSLDKNKNGKPDMDEPNYKASISCYDAPTPATGGGSDPVVTTPAAKPCDGPSEVCACGWAKIASLDLGNGWKLWYNPTAFDRPWLQAPDGKVTGGDKIVDFTPTLNPTWNPEHGVYGFVAGPNVTVKVTWDGKIFTVSLKTMTVAVVPQTPINFGLSKHILSLGWETAQAA
jgi:hypothetical protein